ncbi:MAG: Na/Pi symporter [Pseudomonadota bacterium]
MTFSMLAALFGGIGLFLLGMRLLTDGLKLAAGNSLRNILASSTKTPLMGILSGAFLTSMVQSSSAVTVATLGFVNAGIMDLSQAITLVYGSNLGSTMTGWLVSLVGFQVDIQLFALPAIGLGMALRVTGPEGRRAAIGDVLAGFGIFFLGINVLKTSLGDLGNGVEFARLAGNGLLGTAFFVGIGFLLTCLMQASGAAIALTLTAVAGGIIPFHDAAAVVIGANVGTTSTAALAAIGATSNAKRLAAAHVIFNLITGIVAFCLLPFLLSFLHQMQSLLGLGSSEVIMLALFHTVFNVLGILLLSPATGLLVRFLDKRFRTAEEDEARPRYLDHTVTATPVLAIHALDMELKRMGDIARRMAKAAISVETAPSPRLAFDKGVIDKLVEAVADFGKKLQQAQLPRELSEKLPDGLRVSGYFSDIAELAIKLAALQPSQSRILQTSLADDMAHFKSRSVQFLDQLHFTEDKEISLGDSGAELEGIKEEYRSLKAKLLRAASRGEISASQMVNCLDIMAHIRRIVEQSEKSGRYLAGIIQAEKILSQQKNMGAKENEAKHGEK